MAAKYKINRSNYTLRTRHQLTSGGVVYERDFMTTTNLGPWDSGSIPYGESNFRMLYRRPENARKRPRTGYWLEHDGSCQSEKTVWTYPCIKKSGVTEEKLIKIKPNYNSLLDFAYYGSCQELVKSTIKKIIETFPGELISYGKEKYVINGNTYYLVENPFGIDLFDSKIYGNIKDFSGHCTEYNVITAGGVYPISASSSIEKHEGCDHGDILGVATIKYGSNGSSSFKIYKIVYDSEPRLFTDRASKFEVRPNSSVTEEFFEGLDDFGNLLLNRDSYPKYTATLDWPHDTSYGVKTYKRSFTWPTSGDWNLDIESILYGNYIEELLSIAEFYDDRYSDNLWRMLTHDSIKSMDLAFSNPSKDEGEEDYNVGATRLEGLLWAYGRQFDDLKRAIDNIKFTSNITYDENNNMPDYFLSDSLELSGWEVYNVDKGFEGKNVSLTWGNIYGTGVEKTYTSEDVNNIFLRELKLNSKHIFQKKGTVDGMISLLGLFGMEYGEDFEIHEQVAVVKDNIETKPINEQFDMEKLNSLKVSSDTAMEDKGLNTFDGIPFTYVENGANKYIIPWFDSSLKYDGDMYFQMKGGWGKKPSGDCEYDETLKYLIVVNNKEELYTLPAAKRYKGAVCYVEDEGAYYEVRSEVDSNTENGWTSSVSQSKIDCLNSIIDDFKGNNPHVGFGNYDGGKEYLERIKVPFSYHVSANTKDNPMFSDAAYDCNGNYDSKFITTKIKVDEGVEDDKKVWFFGKYIDEGWVEKNGLNIDYSVYDFESGSYAKKATEPSANSVINTKIMKIVFYTPVSFLTAFAEYIKEVVLPYLKQIIPSTTIWGYAIRAKETISVQAEDKAASPIALVVDAVAYDNSGDNINDDYIANYVESHNSRSW